jgi:hypothetical protein
MSGMRAQRPLRLAVSFVGARGRGDTSAGWISVTDSLLLGFGMMMCVAIATAARARTTASERNAIQQYARTVEAENEQRKKLLKDLSGDAKEAMAVIAQLETQKVELTEKFAALKGQHEEVITERVRLAEQLSATRTQLESLQAAMRGKLEKLQAALARVEQQRDALTSQSEQVRAEAKRVAEQLTRMIEQRDQANKAREQVAIQLSGAVAMIRELESKVSDDKGRSSRLEPEVVLRRELIGFKGKLKKVAFVVDGSGSMGVDADRWPNAKKTVVSWIENLDVQECIVIVFTNLVHRFPEKAQETYRLTGVEREANVERVKAHLEQRRPVGFTNTLGALRAAYDMPGVDTIVLFTDGAPYAGLTEKEKQAGMKDGSVRTADGLHNYDPQMMEAIYSLCSEPEHADIPVNVVGVGDFYSPEFAAFLLRIAKITKGTFIGR